MVSAELIEKITDEHRLILIELLKDIENGEIPVSYGQLAKQVKEQHGVEINAHLHIHNKLALLSEICFELGLPMISVVVVNKDTQKPGQGFYILYDKLNGTNYSGNNSDENKIKEKIENNVRNCKNWSELKNVLRINNSI